MTLWMARELVTVSKITYPDLLSEIYSLVYVYVYLYGYVYGYVYGYLLRLIHYPWIAHVFLSSGCNHQQTMHLTEGMPVRIRL